ncbi:hypothetical protein BD779DRAFT_1444238, partial [Infundibulicybe gibba]
DNPLLFWLPNRDRYVAEDLRWEGRGGCPDSCNRCNGSSANYRCIDCDGGQLLCGICIKEVHICNGLHRISEWNGNYFAETSLKALGYRFQLGHRVGEKCLSPQPAFADSFVIIDVNGVHEVALDFCNCETAQLDFVQLLRYRWLPATVSKPKSACTFRALKHFHLLSFESKISGFEFYRALACLSNNTGITPPKDRYRSLMIMIRIYRHMKMLKRSGKGHDVGGSAATKPGECAVMCPTCPQPRMNLPLGWEQAEASKRYLYRLFLGIDANFRLKRKNVSSNEVDPGLANGWAYFVGETDFKGFLQGYGRKIKQAPSTCSNHSAVNASRSAKGLAATGVGTIDCARHDMKRPSSVGDLQEGEKYINMDYFFFSSIRDTSLTDIVVSYDIACQWSINIWARMKSYPHYLHTDYNGRKAFYFLVPKFHLPAHVMACQTTFSFNFNRYVGRTDGEAPERGWSHNNPIASSVKEMGPGSRRDTMDDHFGDWNWKKTTLLGLSLLRKIKVAVKESNDRKFLHNQFESGLPKAAVEQWRCELDAWESDHNAPNPYRQRINNPTKDAVRRALADEETRDDQAAYILHADISASSLISMGLDLEEQQQQIINDSAALGQYATEDQKGRLQTRADALRRKISAWIDVQHFYMPGLIIIRNQSQKPYPQPPVGKIQLYLPSSAPPRSGCDPRLQKLEWQLRRAQASDALDELRNSLRLRSYLYIDKDRFQRGQRANTRARSIIQRAEKKVALAAKIYSTTRTALLALVPILSEADISDIYPELLPQDIRGLSQADDNQARSGRVSEGRRTVSWIWTHLGGSSQVEGDEGLNDALRIEWCKSKARADRWSEEVELLREEMRRVCAFFETRAVEWERRAEYSRSTPSPLGLSLPSDLPLTQGRIAYATDQAAQFRAMRTHCQILWRFVSGYIQNEWEMVIPPEVTEEASE